MSNKKLVLDFKLKKEKYIRLYLILILFLFMKTSYGQWTGGPESPREFVLETTDPVNIVSAEDRYGGVFIVWEDKKGKSESNIFYQHITSSGEISFRADGKAVNTAGAKKFSPQVSSGAANSAFVSWHQNKEGKYPILMIQSILNNGSKLWEDEGIAISNGDEEIYYTSLAGSINGKSYSAYLEKTGSSPTNYTLKVQRISTTGYTELRGGGLVVSSSFNAKNMCKVIADNSGGAFIFWSEFKNTNNYIYCNYVTPQGNLLNLVSPVEIAVFDKIITSYMVEKISNNRVYIVMQIQGRENNMAQQIVDQNLQTYFAKNGQLIPLPEGENSNPTICLTSDSSVVLSWVNDYAGNKEIYAQKFGYPGKAQWGLNGVKITDYKGDQFGQMICGDQEGGAIVTWLDKRNSASKTDIFSQRIDKFGKLVWNEQSMPVSISENPFKSYLNVFSDDKNGVVAVFKESGKNKSGIYAQHIFGNDTFLAQIVDFSGAQNSDKIILYWKSSNEINIKGFRLEESVKSENKDSSWVQIEYVLADPLLKNRYQIYHQPRNQGPHYYKLSMLDNAGVLKNSVITKVEFSPKLEKLAYVSQNVPNPFSDSTKISYEISKQQNVKFEFFNSKFDLLKEVKLANLSPGKNTLTFYGSDLPVGIYFYRFTADEFVEVKKMIISR